MGTRPYESKDVTLANGVTMRYYEWAGDGPTLIMCHGSSGYGLMWEWVADGLEGCRVIAPDWRGHGDSDKPEGDYSAEEYAGDLHLLLQALGLKSAVITGQSLGGRIAQVFAAIYPEECEGIVLVGGVHLSNFWHTRERSEQIMRSAMATLNSETEFPSYDAALEYLRKLRPRDTDDFHKHRIEHNMVKVGDGYRVKYDKVRVAQGLMHMNTDLVKYAASIRCPIAFIRVEPTGEVSAEEGPQITALWTNAKVYSDVVQGQYIIHMSSPGPLAATIKKFLESHVGAGATA